MRVAGEPPSAAELDGVLRSAERDHRRRRAAEAGAGLHRRPAARRRALSRRWPTPRSTRSSRWWRAARAWRRRRSTAAAISVCAMRRGRRRLGSRSLHGARRAVALGTLAATELRLPDRGGDYARGLPEVPARRRRVRRAASSPLRWLSVHENRRRWNWLRRSGHGHLLCRQRQRRDLRRHRQDEDRRAQPRRDSHLRAGPGRDGRAQRRGRAAVLHHRPGRGGEAGRDRLPGRRHAAGRRRRREPVGPVERGRDDRPAPAARRGRRHQEHRAGRHVRAHHEHAARVHRPRLRRGVEPRVPQGRRRDRGLHEARPRGRRRAAARGGRRAAAALRAVPAHREAVSGRCRPRARR